MPDDVQELNFNYWTSLSRRGCVGNIKNCFYKQISLVKSFPYYDNYFWRMFDRTTKGACVALQSLPFGMNEAFGQKKLERFPLGPVFVQCNELNYFACEAQGRRSKFIHETDLRVKFC